MKHTRRIIFQKKYSYANKALFGDFEITSSELCKKVMLYCVEQNINMKKLHLQGTCRNSILKIVCDKPAYNKLCIEISNKPYGIEIVKVK